MPVCSYFLKGICSNSNCPYSHVYVSRKAEVCTDFLKGYCPLGAKVRGVGGGRGSRVCPRPSRSPVGSAQLSTGAAVVGKPPAAEQPSAPQLLLGGPAPVGLRGWGEAARAVGDPGEASSVPVPREGASSPA